MVFCGLFGSKKQPRTAGSSNGNPEQQVSVPLNEIKRLKLMEQHYLQLKKENSSKQTQNSAPVFQTIEAKSPKPVSMKNVSVACQNTPMNRIHRNERMSGTGTPKVGTPKNGTPKNGTPKNSVCGTPRNSICKNDDSAAQISQLAQSRKSSHATLKIDKFGIRPSESDFLHQITELENMLHEKTQVIEEQQVEMCNSEKNREFCEGELLKKLKSREDRNANLQYELDEMRRKMNS